MPTLLERQIENEELAIGIGIQNYLTGVKKAYGRNEATMLAPENYLLRSVIQKVTEAITTQFTKSPQGPPSYIRTKTIITAASPEAVAYITLKVCLDNMKPTPLVQLSRTIAKNIGMHIDYLLFKKQMPGYVKAIEETMNNKDLDYKIRAMRNYMGDKKIARFHFESIKERINVGTFCLYKLLETVDLFEMIEVYNGGKRKKMIQPSPLTIQWLENAHQQCAELSVQYLPMLIAPSPWESMYSGGFVSCAGQYRIPAVRAKHKSTFKELEEYASMKGIYDVLNRLQETPYKVNTKVLEVMKVCREHSLAGLPVITKEHLDMPTPFWENQEEYERLCKEQPERIKAWKVERATKYDLWYRLTSKKLMLHWQIWTADKFVNDQFYFVWNCDWRGRVYPIQSYLNPQADGNGKALLLFANGKALGKTGARSLAIHGANVYGEDKVSVDDRVKWVKDHQDLILDSATNPLDGERFWMHADKPFMFLAFCLEWAGYVKEGDQYVSHLPVASDGSCSGLQHYSGLFKDEVGGYYTNLIPREKPADVYMKVAEEVQKDIAKDTENPLAAVWNGKVDRGLAKRPTMTFSYSATVYGYAEQTKEELRKRDEKGGDPYLGDCKLNQKAANYFAKVVLGSISNVVVKAYEGMEWLKTVAEMIASAGCELEWTTPSGMVVKHKYYKANTKLINTFHGSTRIRLHYNTDTNVPNPQKQKTSIAPNFIHSLDASHLALTVKACVKEGITDFAMIHDSFGCHAADMDKMNMILRREFVKMYSNDVLAGFMEQLKAQLPAEVYESLPKPPAKGNLDLTQVEKSVYFFI